jgi:branched-chain amino acid aminotransferase
MGLEVLSIIPKDPDVFEKIEQDILKLIQKNGLSKGGRVRLTVSRSSAGFYRPEDENGLDYHIAAYTMPENGFALNEKGLIVDIYTDFRKQINRMAYFKTLNCQLYIMASVHAKQKGLDNVLLTNENDCIIEAANSNLFIVSNGVLYTPPLADGCLGGTMRMEVINTAIRHDIKVYETTLRPQNLLVADEVFLTNATLGIQWVSAYRQKRYYHNQAQRLVQYLNEEVSL